MVTPLMCALIWRNKKETKKWQRQKQNNMKTKPSLRGIIKFQYYLHQTFIIIMIFISLSHHIVSITSIITSNKQTKKEKKSYYCHNYTNKLSPYVPSPFVAFSRLTTFCKLRPLLLRCFMTKTCELCIGGTIVLHRPSVLQNKTRQNIATWTKCALVWRIFEIAKNTAIVNEFYLIWFFEKWRYMWAQHSWVKWKKSAKNVDSPQEIEKLIVALNTYSNLTNFWYEEHAITRNGSVTNLLKKEEIR